MSRSVPFSNGTEADAWMSAWCAYCVHDHGMHDGGDGDGCPIALHALLADDPFDWPSEWLPEPDDGRRALPSRMVCRAFSACGPCGGDPGAEERARRAAEVEAYWHAKGL